MPGNGKIFERLKFVLRRFAIQSRLMVGWIFTQLESRMRQWINILKVRKRLNLVDNGSYILQHKT